MEPIWNLSIHKSSYLTRSAQPLPTLVILSAKFCVWYVFSVAKTWEISFKRSLVSWARPQMKLICSTSNLDSLRNCGLPSFAHLSKKCSAFRSHWPSYVFPPIILGVNLGLKRMVFWNSKSLQRSSVSNAKRNSKIWKINKLISKLTGRPERTTWRVPVTKWKRATYQSTWNARTTCKSKLMNFKRNSIWKLSRTETKKQNWLQLSNLRTRCTLRHLILTIPNLTTTTRSSKSATRNLAREITS